MTSQQAELTTELRDMGGQERLLVTFFEEVAEGSEICCCRSMIPL
jgi:hypothetical protein